jgi:hypothetical protein
VVNEQSHLTQYGRAIRRGYTEHPCCQEDSKQEFFNPTHWLSLLPAEPHDQVHAITKPEEKRT